MVEDGARLEAPRQRDGGRAGVPRREDIRPRVLGPAGRGNVEMHVVGLQAEPVHGRQMADRIARVRVQHQLRLRRGAGSEIEQQRVARPRRRVRLEMRARPHELGPVAPARRRAADGDTRQQAGAAPLELRRGGRLGDDEAHAAARQPVIDVGVVELRRRRDDHQAELHRRQQRDPQRRDIAEHQQQPVAALGAERAQAVGDPRRSLRQFGEGIGLGPLAEQRQRRPRAVLARGEFAVEPVERPVEAIEFRPGEFRFGGRIIGRAARGGSRGRL